MNSNNITKILESVERHDGHVRDTTLSLRAFPCLVTRRRGVSEDASEIVRDLLDFGESITLKTDLSIRNKLFLDIKEELRQIDGLQIGFLGDYTQFKVTYPVRVTEDVEAVYKRKLRYKIHESLS